MPKLNLSKDERFFYDHAGWSYNPQTESKLAGHMNSAKQLAEAERQVRNLGWRFDWQDDWTVGSHTAEYGKDCGEPETCESCIVYSEVGTILASLHCIDDADHNYRRVIEAELALEALANYDREIEILDAH
jgi:hypothetical protein